MKIRTLLLSILIIAFCLTSFSQNEMKKLYESKKYVKCIKLCEKNIKENIEKQKALLYKSMVLTDASKNKDILKNYPDPFIDAVKCIKRIEFNNKKHPYDKFYAGHTKQIKYVVTKANEKADMLFKEKDLKRSVKIFNLLKLTYPDEPKYVFKIAKVYNFNTKTILTKYSKINEDDYYDQIYEVAENSSKYLSKTAKTEILGALESMYNNSSCDLQTASIFLVMYRKNYTTDAKFNEIEKKYQEKFWQIDMLIKVNKKRASVYTCGDKEMKAQPPLILDNCLTRTTQKYAELIDKEEHFSHTGPNGSSPWERAREEGCSADGENIAWGNRNVDGALSQWMNSPGHCQNIMGYHTRMGIGESGTYWVQLFK
ncbi:MAG: CAP domain-containing protein [Bacteroidales bacterium]|nr:CAP domain-containing protein [Bacteroidales bacterium]